ncbi:DUF1796 family putative cysteine peptidase [Paenibacillus pinistramenti]|uniref:DUF1796 family putative cysteine peptidase n=1 Tax=Paenibacillus pinistramenti TaxID=1768003 RepID=UPI001108A6EB|nr:DUF1796 family putative cysteine peptidase [Paenibacillus pinistramenti]
MNWKHCRGVYPAYISLGATCQTAYQLRRLGLRQSAGPLDWFLSYSVPHLSRLLRLQFKDFWKWENLRTVNIVQNHYVIQDTAYQIESYHDFPVPYDPRTLYPSFREKADRRTARFLRLIKEHPVCFVRILTTSSEAYQLERALNPIANKGFRLLIVNLHQDASREISYDDWGIQRVASVTISGGRDWRGFDPGWNRIMEGFKRAGV